MLSRSLRTIAAIAVLMLGTQAHAQSIASDPVVQQAIQRENWEPGGAYFGFSARGSVDPNSRVGQVTVTPTHNVRLGSFSLQGATIQGSYGFVAVFSGHPYTSHSPFSSSNSLSDEVRVDNPDGTQSSVSLQWLGFEVHPADGYDGPQGGGYPPPAGARDIYSFDISGVATGIYLLSGADLQTSNPAPGFMERTGAYGDATVRNLQSAWDRYLQGGEYIVYGEGFAPRAEGVLDIGLSIRDAILSGLAGAIEGYAGPELAWATQQAGNVAVIGFRRADTQWQYASLSSYDSAADWIAENPLAMKALDAALTVAALRAATGPRATSGPAAAGTVDDLVEGLANRVSNARRNHILDGDGTGGGHRYGAGQPGRSEFPQGWSDDRIINTIERIANDPNVPPQSQGTRLIREAEVDGVQIRVVQEANGDIVTGYPTNTPRNPRGPN